MGFDKAGDYFARGLRALEGLNPGTYYIKAYATNSAATGEGDAVPLLVPRAPSVVTVLHRDTIDGAVLTLGGRIEGTGGESSFCRITQFKYRVMGDKEWQTVGLVLNSK